MQISAAHPSWSEEHWNRCTPINTVCSTTGCEQVSDQDRDGLIVCPYHFHGCPDGVRGSVFCVTRASELGFAAVSNEELLQWSEGALRTNVTTPHDGKFRKFFLRT